MDRVWVRVILIVVGVGAWGPVVYMRHFQHRHLGFTDILPFLLLHVTCMGTLLYLRLRRKKRDKKKK